MYDCRWHDLITLLAGRRKGLEATMKKTLFLHQLRGHRGFLEVFEMVKLYQEIPLKTRQTTTVAPSVMRKWRRRTVTKNELHLFRNSMRKCWLPYIGKWNNSSGKTKVLWLDDHVKVVQPFFYCESGCGVSRTKSCLTVNIFCKKSAVEMGCKEIEIIHRLFLVIAMYCQASSMNY